MQKRCDIPSLEKNNVYRIVKHYAKAKYKPSDRCKNLGSHPTGDEGEVVEWFAILAERYELFLIDNTLLQNHTWLFHLQIFEKDSQIAMKLTPARSSKFLLSPWKREREEET